MVVVVVVVQRTLLSFPIVGHVTGKENVPADKIQVTIGGPVEHLAVLVSHRHGQPGSKSDGKIANRGRLDADGVIPIQAQGLGQLVGTLERPGGRTLAMGLNVS